MIRRQGAIYHYRRRVPADLRTQIGRSEIWLSLNTASRIVARSRAGHLIGGLTALFDRLRNMPDDAAKRVSEARLRAKIEELRARAIDEIAHEEEALRVCLESHAERAMRRSRMMAEAA